MQMSLNVEKEEVLWVRPLMRTNLVTASYLFAHQETPRHCQSMGKVVNAVG